MQSLWCQGAAACDGDAQMVEGERQHRGAHLGAEALPLHPHDATLQWALELGVPGLMLGLAIVVFVLYRVGWRETLPAHERAAGLALCGSAIIVALLSFGIWQAWWQSTLWLIAASYAASICADPESGSERRLRADQR